MHEKYTTRGFVLFASAYREADKIISIYTEDFGLVSAVAAGVRRSASKLRYHTQNFSVRSFSLVHGRDLWRLVGAEEIAGVIVLTPRLLQNLWLFTRAFCLSFDVLSEVKKKTSRFSRPFLACTNCLSVRLRPRLLVSIFPL